MRNEVWLGDSFELIKKVPDNSINLEVFSPPYSDRRKSTYGGVKPEDYVDWFLPLSKELLRVLNPRGSFILNIKTQAVDGELSTYVLELVLALKKQGWKWIEEYCWKRDSTPGWWPNRFKNSFEPCYHFAREKHFDMYQDNMRIPLDPTDVIKKASPNERHTSSTGSGFGVNYSNFKGREYKMPSNVIEIPPTKVTYGHPAVYPVALPEWFIKCFTKPGDLILDPFGGSGSTAEACILNDRDYLLFERLPEYYEKIQQRIKDAKNRPEVQLKSSKKLTDFFS